MPDGGRMADIININKNKPPSRNTVVLINLSNDIDFLIKKYVKLNIKPAEIAGVISVVLGRFIGRFTNKEKLFVFLIKKMRSEAQIK